MCKYCEEIEEIWLKRRNFYYKTPGEYMGEEKRLGAICDFENDSFFKAKTYLSLMVENNEWFDIRINYCPFCGKNLKRKTISGIIKAIIDYKYKTKYRKELELGICKCSKCGKNIKSKLELGESIMRDGKKIFCEDCCKDFLEK